MRRLMIVLVAVFGLAAYGCGDGLSVDNLLYPGQTDFENTEPGSDGYRGAPGFDSANGTKGGAEGSQGTPPGAPPQGRTADVEEADIYRVQGNNMFYLNTYRGFMIFDVKDPKTPKVMSRLPVYGYPVEMFVQKNTVYALIRDALYLTQVKGKMQFKRHNVSQLVAIDISDLNKPKVLQTIDITGELREGVSRKVADTVYVVSYHSKYYYRGWNYNPQQQQNKEQAWVYAFNVKDPKNLKLVQKLKVFEGGGYNVSGSNHSEGRYFQGVTISATSNVLMVVENWRTYGYVWGGPKCGKSESLQQAMVTLIDISDPTGKIDQWAKFETYGHLGDQFKQTYFLDKKTNKAYYMGIFARREWSSSNCSGSSVIQNTLEAWDVTSGGKPKRVDTLSFGKPNETVRGSVFDADRRVAFAITARRVDPLYALSFADPGNLKVASYVDGLSGDMNVFRFINNKKFLIAIGRDNTETCTGFNSSSTGWATNVAVSVIDVQNLSKIQLVQRQCVAVKNAKWVSSQLNWNRDQAHKMIGMHSDSKANVITVPVYYWVKDNANGWWYSRYETAVGMMTWDLSKYVPGLPPEQQQVLENYGTIIHPKGQVRRTVVFQHPTVKRRMVLNLSDTHISLVDVEDLSSPVMQSMLEVAPFQAELFKFKDAKGAEYMVEHVRAGPSPSYYSYYYSGQATLSEFRVKKVGAKRLEDTPEVAAFAEGGVERVVPYKNHLLLFRRVSPSGKGYSSSWHGEVMIYDLTNPAKPTPLTTVKLPTQVMPYYSYWFGPWCYWGGWWWNDIGAYGHYYPGYYPPYYWGSSGWTMTDSGPVFLAYTYDYKTGKSSRKLVFLDLTTPGKPKVKEHTLTSSSSWYFFHLVPDQADSDAFYLSYRTKVGTTKMGDHTFNVYKYYAQRWSHDGTSWKAGASVNLPGRLAKTWKQGSERRFMAFDFTYKKVHNSKYDYSYWKATYRLNLLRQIAPFGKPVAELLDHHAFPSYYLKDMVLDGSRLYVNARPDYYYIDDHNLNWWEVSDHLMIFDTAKQNMSQVYSEPTGTYNVRLMGVNKGRLFVNLPGDGLLVVNTDNPSQPTGQQFMRTLGYATHLEFAKNRAYVAAGYFGIFEMDLLQSKSQIPYL